MVMTVCGNLAALAYVPQRCTVAEAFKVIEMDLTLCGIQMFWARL